MQFGVAGSNFTSMGEETKESAVGRRDLFSLPPDPNAGVGRGRGRG